MNACENHLRTIGRTFIVLAFLASAIMVLGCGKQTVAVKRSEDGNNLACVAMAYKQVAGQGNPPRSINEIMPVLEKMGDPQTLLRSPRDGQPYVIVWGIDFRKVMAGRNKMSPGNMPIIAYEQQGKDGKRMAIDLGMKVKEYTAEEFARLKLPPSSTPR